jgi:hypothetical protein
MSTSKVNPNATIISKLEVPTTNLNPYHRDVQQRISSSKRTTNTMINNFDPSVDTTVLHQSRTQYISKSIKQKDRCDTANISPSKPESGSEEIYTAPLNNDHMKISSSVTQKQRARQGIGDYIGKDADEESTTACAIMNTIKTPTEHIHRLSTSVNNSAVRLQQQGMGDHYHTSAKQHKTRSKTTAALNRKYHRLIEQHDLEIALDERKAYRWRLFMYILTILVLAFVIYRFLLAMWPKPRKTFMEQLISDLSTFFTP